MIQTCHHVMPSGLHCQAPAMRGFAFCYHHANRNTHTRKSSAAEINIQLPATLDGSGAVQVIHQVLNALASNQISPRRASMLLYGLQMAISHPQQSAPTSPEFDFDQLPPEIHATLCRIMNDRSDQAEERQPSISQG